MSIKIKAPALVALALASVLAVASQCGEGRPLNPCPSGGCVVNPDPSGIPADQTLDPPNSAYELFDCRTTHDKGPCVQWYPDTSGVCRWWYVPIGELFTTGAVYLGDSQYGTDCEEKAA